MSHLLRARCCATAVALAMTITCVQAQPPRAVNPLLVKPVDQITPEEVRFMQQRLSDWPDLARYRDANSRVPAKQAGVPRVLFYGDSITQLWGEKDPSTFFPGKGYLNRGISGQTTPQLLLRFQQDVIALQPDVVVILAGTNDIAGNTGPSTQAMIEDNLHAMVDLAGAHGIRVVLASVLPVSEYRWMPGIEPATKVQALNAALKQYADAKGVVYLDYHSAMTNAEGGLDPALAADGVHPTAKGYALMAPLAEQAIKRALDATPPAAH